MLGKTNGIATKGKFIRQKCYIQKFEDEEEYLITCAGLPSNLYKFVTFDNFKEGFTANGKLIFSHVIGGVKLIETDFTIKSDNFIKFIDKK